jgi:hypothetical protein
MEQTPSKPLHENETILAGLACNQFLPILYLALSALTQKLSWLDLDSTNQASLVIISAFLLSKGNGIQI